MIKTNAAGTEGYLLQLPVWDENSTADKPALIGWDMAFRVYNPDNTFIDYKIKHPDLKVKLLDGILFTEEGSGQGYVGCPRTSRLQERLAVQESSKLNDDQLLKAKDILNQLVQHYGPFQNWTLMQDQLVKDIIKILSRPEASPLDLVARAKSVFNRLLAIYSDILCQKEMQDFVASSGETESNKKDDWQDFVASWETESNLHDWQYTGRAWVKTGGYWMNFYERQIKFFIPKENATVFIDDKGNRTTGVWGDVIKREVKCVNSADGTETIMQKWTRHYATPESERPE